LGESVNEQKQLEKLRDSAGSPDAVREIGAEGSTNSPAKKMPDVDFTSTSGMKPLISVQGSISSRR